MARAGPAKLLGGRQSISAQTTIQRTVSALNRNRNEVHPLATALDCHIVVAVAAINRCLRVERPAFFSEPAPDQLPS
jgi:hypothetical protein